MTVSVEPKLGVVEWVGVAVPDTVPVCEVVGLTVAESECDGDVSMEGGELS